MIKDFRIDKARARMRFDIICQDKNEEMPTISFTRVINGVEQECQRKQKAISDGAQATGKALILSYAHYFRSKIDIMPEGWFTDVPPSLPTNSEKLSKFRQNVTSRTIRNHIKELKEIGLITAYKFHGTKHNYELWLDADVIFGAAYEQVRQSGISDTGDVKFTKTESVSNQPFNKATESSTNSLNGTNFPLRQSKETNSNTTTTIQKVDKSSISRLQSHGNPATKPTNASEVNGNKVLGGGGDRVVGSENVDNSAKSVDNHVDKWKSGQNAGADYRSQDRYFQKRISDFWRYAAKSLWEGQGFTEWETLTTLDFITDGIYRPFLNERPNKNQFLEFHEELMRSIDVAAKYYKAYPDKYPGDPYSNSAYARGYFDKNNTRGFKLAAKWRFVNKASQHEDYGKKLIKMGMLHLENHPKGKAPKHLQVKTYSEVVDYYVTKLKNYSQETQREFAKRLNTLTFKAI